MDLDLCNNGDRTEGVTVRTQRIPPFQDCGESTERGFIHLVFCLTLLDHVKLRPNLSMHVFESQQRSKYGLEQTW